MKKPVKNLPDSVKAMLAHLARGPARPFNEVLQNYAIERFLFRLSCSPHHRNFILKGGLIFYAWQVPLVAAAHNSAFAATWTAGGEAWNT